MRNCLSQSSQRGAKKKTVGGALRPDKGTVGAKWKVERGKWAVISGFSSLRPWHLLSCPSCSSMLVFDHDHDHNDFSFFLLPSYFLLLT